MKKINTLAALIALPLAIGLGTQQASAQSFEVVTESGTITEVAPGKQFIVNVGEDPSTYYWSDETVIIDAEGRIVERDMLIKGQPATVEYRVVNDRHVAQRIVMAPVDVATGVLTTSHSSTGTIVGATTAERINVRTAEAPEPVEYMWTDETVIVGADGKVATREIIKEDTPTRVFYRDVDGRRVVDRVMVTKTTTTTTTTKK